MDVWPVYWDGLRLGWIYDEHDWVEVTSFDDPDRVFVCADPWCDEIKREPNEPRPGLFDAG